MENSGSSLSAPPGSYNECSAYPRVHEGRLGLDVHKDTIAVAVALPGREEPVYRGEIKNQRKSLLRLIRAPSPNGELVSFCYEAGSCGYGVYREIIETGHHCAVVAPSLIPRRSGERVKTDRRDALMLARLRRAGELRAVWVADEEQEAMRDLTRFDSPRELMSFLGLVPSEHSSGGRRRRGGITKTGNGHVRRVLVEAAWSYRLPARKTAHPRRKAQAAPPAVQAIAWAAQKRLCARYWHLYHAGKAKCQVTTAVARELVGFLWAIACEVMGRPHTTRAVS